MNLRTVFVIVAIAIGSIGSLQSARADQIRGLDQRQIACSHDISVAVQKQAETDFPDRNITVFDPNLDGWDGGNYTGIYTIVGISGRVVAVYSTDIDEICHVFQTKREL